MADLEQSLAQFTTRYRYACVAKVGLWAALGAGCVAAWRWRLGDSDVLSNAVLPLGVGGLGVAGILWWLHRHWLSSRATPGYLDAVLGLKERLLTAAEFLHAPQPPALYPLLIEDVTGRLARGQVRIPRIFDRSTAVFLAVLLLLLIWPGGHRPGVGLLAQRPQAPIPRPPAPLPDAPEPPPPPPEPSRDQSSSAQQAPQPQPSSGSDQPQAGPSPEQAPSQGAAPTATTGEDAGSPSSTAADGPSQGAGGGPSQPSPAPAAPHPQRPGDATAEAQASAQPAETGGSREPSSTSPAAPKVSAGDQASAQPAGAAGQSQQGEEQGQGRRGERPGESPRPQGDGGRGQRGGTAPGGQDELTAEIRGLLQEMADELEQLEQQITASQPPQPTPGMSTDPELFDGGTPEPPSGGRGMPLSLETDEVPTQTPRPGGGLGERSETVGRGGPRMTPDDASLSDAPRPEGAAAARPPVPPEYRSVFDRLFQRRPSSEEPES